MSLRYNRQNFTGVGFENGGSTNAFEHTGDSLVKTDTVAGSLTSLLHAGALQRAARPVRQGQRARHGQQLASPEATINQGGTPS